MRLTEELDEITQILTESRRLNSRRAVKLRHTLKLKGRAKALVARRTHKGIKIRLRTGHDLLRNRLKALRHRINPFRRNLKKKRSYRLIDRGFRS